VGIVKLKKYYESSKMKVVLLSFAIMLTGCTTNKFDFSVKDSYNSYVPVKVKVPVRNCDNPYVKCGVNNGIAK
jgi:starvation-inducible outer membrane lipoprotein